MSDEQQTLPDNKPLDYSWQPAFLTALATMPNVSAAARSAGVNRQYVYEVRKADPLFAALWDDAVEQATDQLEQRAYELAVSGIQGISPPLLIFLLKGRRREIYGDQARIDMDAKVNHSGSVHIYVPDNGKQAEGSDQCE
jgi:hypothetical protein